MSLVLAGVQFREPPSVRTGIPHSIGRPEVRKRLALKDCPACVPDSKYLGSIYHRRVACSAGSARTKLRNREPPSETTAGRPIGHSGADEAIGHAAIACNGGVAEAEQRGIGRNAELFDFALHAAKLGFHSEHVGELASALREQLSQALRGVASVGKARDQNPARAESSCPAGMPRLALSERPEASRALTVSCAR